MHSKKKKGDGFLHQNDETLEAVADRIEEVQEKRRAEGGEGRRGAGEEDEGVERKD
jgi:hypothetical protein